jgi:hypothetical protein
VFQRAKQFGAASENEVAPFHIEETNEKSISSFMRLGLSGWPHLDGAGQRLFSISSKQLYDRPIPMDLARGNGGCGGGDWALVVAEGLSRGLARPSSPCEYFLSFF